jgi:hypothetical protein
LCCIVVLLSKRAKDGEGLWEMKMKVEVKG